jgi:hypothetical protein
MMACLRHCLLTGILLLPMRRSTGLSEAPVLIEGAVREVRTDRGLPGMLVYTERGEEEAVTDGQGRFHLRTWKKLPLMLRVQGVRKEKMVLVESAGKELRIWMDAE